MGTQETNYWLDRGQCGGNCGGPGDLRELQLLMLEMAKVKMNPSLKTSATEQQFMHI